MPIKKSSTSNTTKKKTNNFLLIMLGIMGMVIVLPFLSSETNLFTKANQADFYVLEVVLNSNDTLDTYNINTKPSNLSLNVIDSEYMLSTESDKNIKPTQVFKIESIVEGETNKTQTGLQFKVKSYDRTYTLIKNNKTLLNVPNTNINKSLLDSFKISSLNVNNPNLVTAHKNTDNRSIDKSLDILIVGCLWDGKLDEYNKAKDKAVNDLLADEYYSKLLNRINITYLDKPVLDSDLGCGFRESTYGQGLIEFVPLSNYFKVLDFTNKYNADTAILLFGIKGRSNAIKPKLQNEILTLGYVNIATVPTIGKNIIKHELGHSIAGLDDEYVKYTSEVPAGLNESSLNCKSSCDSFDPKYTKNCTKGCNYAGAYRVGLASVMYAPHLFSTYTQLHNDYSDKNISKFAPLTFNKPSVPPVITPVIKNDTTKPSVVIIEPKANTIFKDNINIKTYALDNKKLVSHKVFLKDLDKNSTKVLLKDCTFSTNCNFSYSVDSSSLKFELEVEASDDAGNLSSTKINLFKEPKITLTESTIAVTATSTATANANPQNAVIRVYINQAPTATTMSFAPNKSSTTLTAKLNKVISRFDKLTLAFENDTKSGTEYNADRNLSINKIVLDNLVVYTKNANDIEQKEMEKFNVIYDRSNKENQTRYSEENWGNIPLGYFDNKGVSNLSLDYVWWNGGINITYK